ncbi:cullin [Thermococcus aciditolerans]|uniref:Cullin n=1 Tax=Thermococcus aciditolerans TaxID=2598455 RepID=A0A5C0SNJ2_9EURY|nr:cullin [Thermococcus aciditolerans]QEK14738.1 cullin [Thermococcus aciditolerans]
MRNQASSFPCETEVVGMSETHVEGIIDLLQKYGLKEKDWEDLYTAIINLGIRDKAEITRELYNYLSTRYPHHVALGVLAVIRAKHFDDLFDKAKYVPGYHISATGIKVFEKLRAVPSVGNTEEHGVPDNQSVKPAEVRPVEPDPNTIAYWLTGVRT